MTRKQMTLHGALHPRADVDRLYVSRKKGGRGLRSIADVVALEKASLAEYVENANEPILRKLKDEEMVKYENPLQEKKQHIFRERETRWKNKVLHGKWVETINNTCAQTSEWLWGRLFKRRLA